MSVIKNTILIIDDEKQVIELLSTHFRRRGYEPIATINPTIIEETLKAYHVHLIVLDLRMERRSGYDILENLRRQKITTPVLVMTAYLEDEKERLKSLGITECEVIKKPFGDFTEAEALINKTLNRTVMPDEVGSDYEDKIYRHNKASVMIVDDEVEIAECLVQTLESRRYKVKTFEKGKEALDYFKEHVSEVDIAIIDMALPTLSGDLLIQEMLKLNPKVRIIPFSGGYAEEVREKLRKIQFDPKKLLTKPVHIEILIEQVKVLAAEAGLL